MASLVHSGMPPIWFARHSNGTSQFRG